MGQFTLIRLTTAQNTPSCIYLLARRHMESKFAIFVASSTITVLTKFNNGLRIVSYCMQKIGTLVVHFAQKLRVETFGGSSTSCMSAAALGCTTTTIQRNFLRPEHPHAIYCRICVYVDSRPPPAPPPPPCQIAPPLFTYLLVLLFDELQGRHGLTLWPVVFREALFQALLE